MVDEVQHDDQDAPNYTGYFSPVDASSSAAPPALSQLSPTPPAPSPPASSAS
jgi:hypothetical protein